MALKRIQSDDRQVRLGSWPQVFIRHKSPFLWSFYEQSFVLLTEDILGLLWTFKLLAFQLRCCKYQVLRRFFTGLVLKQWYGFRWCVGLRATSFDSFCSSVKLICQIIYDLQRVDIMYTRVACSACSLQNNVSRFYLLCCVIPLQLVQKLISPCVGYFMTNPFFYCLKIF